MINPYFLSIEDAQQGERQSLATVLESISFDSHGLVPVIAQDHQTRDVLMMAWMNRTALNETLASGNMTYWSRSRSKLWRKGESSGNYQQLKSLRIDCDGDTLLCDVEQQGAACHTGRKSCFYLQVELTSNTTVITDSPPNE